MKIGIVAAMESEINYLLTHCEVVNEIKLEKNSFYQCEYGDYDLVVVASGVGKTNASVYTQMLIDYFEPTAVINIGIGGSLSDAIRVLYQLYLEKALAIMMLIKRRWRIYFQINLYFLLIQG
ncbi:5'-methylthioadenosine/S-adenosylhomocysteine nucleosidase [Vagococcus fluvialis]|uniref:5'-methylthioadenosine/S-adenosylhomocysteine nucleosidase n=1 Tax=Vagococcus fluvialis TaxID=2738 RepID=UPI003B594CBD